MKRQRDEPLEGKIIHFAQRKSELRPPPSDPCGLSRGAISLLYYYYYFNRNPKGV